MYGGKYELIYPKFIECIKYTDDIFWKSMFEDLAYGKCPYGIYIHNEFICCNYKDKKFSYKINMNTNSEIIYNEITDIFKNKFGLMSKSDKLEKVRLLNKYQENLSTNLDSDWSNIKKKNIKKILLEKFIIDKCKIYSLSKLQCKQLYNNVMLGIFFKTINKNHIIYKDRKIIDISCLLFSKNKYTFTTNIYNFKTDLLFV